MASGTNKTATGTYIGTGAALDVKLPFNPKAVLIINTTNNKIAIKTDKQADGNHTQITTDGTISQITTQGVTIPEQQAAGVAYLGDIAKFSLGTDAGVNTADSVYLYLAFE